MKMQPKWSKAIFTVNTVKEGKAMIPEYTLRSETEQGNTQPARATPRAKSAMAHARHVDTCRITVLVRTGTSTAHQLMSGYVHG